MDKNTKKIVDRNDNNNEKINNHIKVNKNKNKLEIPEKDSARTIDNICKSWPELKIALDKLLNGTSWHFAAQINIFKTHGKTVTSVLRKTSIFFIFFIIYIFVLYIKNYFIVTNIINRHRQRNI